MAIASTLSGQVGFTVETTPGTRIAPTKWAEVLSATGSFGRKTLRSAAIGGGGAFKRPHVLLGQEPALNIKMEASAENIGNMLRLALGTPVVTGPVSTVYTHTFNWLLTNPLPTATFQLGMTETSDGVTKPFDWIGMMVSSWELGINPNEYVTMTYDLVGRRGVTDQTLATPTWPTLTSWSSVHAALTVLGSTECFTAMTIHGENQLDISDVVCGTNPGERRIRQAGGPMITGSIDQDFEDMSLFNAFTGGTPGALSLVLTNTTSAILTITGRIQFVEDSTPGLAGEAQIIGQSCPFEFVRDAANTDAQTFQVALQTTVATV